MNKSELKLKLPESFVSKIINQTENAKNLVQYCQNNEWTEEQFWGAINFLAKLTPKVFE